MPLTPVYTPGVLAYTASIPFQQHSARFRATSSSGAASSYSWTSGLLAGAAGPLASGAYSPLQPLELTVTTLSVFSPLDGRVTVAVSRVWEVTQIKMLGEDPLSRQYTVLPSPLFERGARNYSFLLPKVLNKGQMFWDFSLSASLQLFADDGSPLDPLVPRFWTPFFDIPVAPAQLHMRVYSVHEGFYDIYM